ncbi:pseudouridine synthase [Perkinsela sp. CCAP 1560/4]|nr:pseudouridine synthase [Perkinsela sp. CCAP 1560/4]|eukprot:KNH06643.1 pseudouridine synthase [Perkinsela sp. CCAP 1560/4]
MLASSIRLQMGLLKETEALVVKSQGVLREVKQIPPILRTMMREKDKKKQLELYSYLQSDSFLESYSHQNRRVHCEAPRISCYFSVSRNDVLVRYTKPLVLTSKKKSQFMENPVRSTYLTAIGASGYSLNTVISRSNLRHTGFSQISYPLVCLLQDRRNLTESKIVEFKTGLKKAGFVYSEPFQGEELQYIDAPDDPAPYNVTVLLRRLDFTGDPRKLISKALTDLTTDGFINYFGRRATMTADQGKNLLSQKWNKFAIGELVAWNMSGTINAFPEISDYARRPSLQTAKNLKNALGDPFKGSGAGEFLKQLLGSNGNMQKALYRFPPACCQRHIRHVQRAIWNALVGVRLRKYGRSVQIGDMVVARETQPNVYIHERTTFPRFMVKTITTKEEIQKYSIFDVVLPLPFNDGEIHPFHFPDLQGLLLEDYLEFSEKFGAKYFWDPPPIVRALLKNCPIELVYRCIMAKPITLDHQVYTDPIRNAQNEKAPTGTERLLMNEYTLLEQDRSGAPFDGPVSGLVMEKVRSLANADKPLQTHQATVPIAQWCITIDGNQVEQKDNPQGTSFNDISLGLNMTLPMDVDFLSCLREAFSFAPLCSDMHRTWMSRIRYAYQDMKKASTGTVGMSEKSLPMSDELDTSPNSFDSTWLCELCGAVNDEVESSCCVCKHGRESSMI